MPAYFNSSDNKEADKRVSEAVTNKLQNEFNDLFLIFLIFIYINLYSHEVYIKC